ncbi:MFS transporter, partial [Actinomadura kijaniata]
QLSSIIAGALAPIIAVELLKDYDSAVPISVYVCVAAVVTTVTVAVVKETRGRDLTRPLTGGPASAAPGKQPVSGA